MTKYINMEKYWIVFVANNIPHENVNVSVSTCLQEYIFLAAVAIIVLCQFYISIFVLLL